MCTCRSALSRKLEKAAEKGDSRMREFAGTNGSKYLISQL